ncbi:DUF1659 domain-containing protein [Peribacillus acanthi]|uniref:DUF1659 domain-containing protein n=1 Tax=Peribacillus acanthi TaxID=2171554 RepID=UPI000D3EB327|nr:DUF1659 domain-containing protein [Peribacillus acanthi]
MATKTIVSYSLRLTFDGGVDGKGNQIFKRKSFSNIDVTATPDQLFATGNAIAVLQGYPLLSIDSQELHELMA